MISPAMKLLLTTSEEAAAFSGLYAYDFRGLQDGTDGNFTAGTGFTGGSATDVVRTPWTFTRATTKYVEQYDGTWVQIPSGTIPLSGLRYSSGYHTTQGDGTTPIDTDTSRQSDGTWGRQGYIPEPARTNQVANSYNLTNWVLVGTGSVLLNEVGITGAANTATTITDSDTGQRTYARTDTTITVASGTQNVIVTIVIKKDSNTSRFPEFIIRNGNNNDLELRFNTATGQVVERTDEFGWTTDTNAVQIGDWWWFSATGANVSGNTTYTIFARPAASSTTINGNDDNNATGSMIVGHVELNDNASTRTSPIITNGSTATRNADALVPTNATQTDTDWTFNYTSSSNETVFAVDLTADASVAATSTVVPNGEGILTLEIVDGS